MQPSGKFYELKNLKRFERELVKKGFRLTDSYNSEGNFEIHLSEETEIRPYGLVLNDEYLLMFNDCSEEIRDKNYKIYRKENFDKLENLVKNFNFSPQISLKKI